MKSLLTREEINYLVNLTINEKAVDWNDSLLGALTNGVAKSFSFLGGKIKKGLQKSKMNSYVIQWGAEYAKAIDAYKNNKEVNVDYQNNTEDVDNTSGDKSVLDVNSFNLVYNLVNELNNSEFRKHFTNKTMINLSTLKKYLDTYLDSIKYDEDVFSSAFNDITTVYEADDNVVNAFNKLLFIIRTINEDIREDSDLYQRLQNELGLEKFVPNESKWPELKQNMGSSILNNLSILSKYLEPIKKEIKPVIEQPTNDNYSLNEAAFKLPSKIEDLYDKEELDKLSKVKDIKLKTFKKINTKAMAVIEYEAQYTIDKAADKDKAELKRIWDIGKKNVENYFQNVVDTKKVNDAIKADEVPADVKTTIDETNKVVDMASKMELTLLDPIKATFKDKLFYVFNMNISGSSGSVSNGYFVVSPVSEFIDEDEQGNKFYYFNIFGQYKFNDKNQNIERINFFDRLTKNSKMDINFKNKQNSYYLVMPMMRVNTGIKQDRLFYIYSNSGKGFYNNQIVDDYSTIINKIKESTKQQWVKIGNAFKYSVNARFSLDTENINKFPGLDTKDLTNEKGTTLAKKNHKILIDNLKTK